MSAEELDRLHEELVELYTKFRKEAETDEEAARVIARVLNSSPGRLERRGHPVSLEQVIALWIRQWKVHPTTKWALYFLDTEELAPVVFCSYEEAKEEAEGLSDTVIVRLDF